MSESIMISRRKRIWTLGILSLVATACTPVLLPKPPSAFFTNTQANVKGALTFYRGSTKVLDVDDTAKLHVNYIVSDTRDSAKDQDAWGKKVTTSQMPKGYDFVVLKPNGEGLGFVLTFDRSGASPVTVGDLAGKSFSSPASVGGYAGGNPPGPLSDLLWKMQGSTLGKVTLTTGGSPLVGSWTSDAPVGADGIDRIDFNLTDL